MVTRSSFAWFAGFAVATWLLFALLPIARGAETPTGTVVKVLPLYLDLKGRSALSPSLFERDAYQEFLRNNPTQRSTLTFAVQWKATVAATNLVTVRLELRGGRKDFDRPLLLESRSKPSRWLSTWTQLHIREAEFRELGEITAWRATLWAGDVMLAEQHSFLW